MTEKEYEIRQRLYDKIYVLEHTRIGLAPRMDNSPLETRTGTDFWTVPDNIDLFLFVLGDNADFIAKLTPEYMDATWRDQRAELWSRAKQNTKQDIQLLNMAEFLQNVGGVPLGDQNPNAYILTNTTKRYGAGALIDALTLERYARAYTENGRVLVIPSSVHEVILSPSLEKLTCTFTSLVQEVNRAQLKEGEILADNAFIVDVNKKKSIILP